MDPAPQQPQPHDPYWNPPPMWGFYEVEVVVWVEDVDEEEGATVLGKRAAEGPAPSANALGKRPARRHQQQQQQQQPPLYQVPPPDRPPDGYHPPPHGMGNEQGGEAAVARYRDLTAAELEAERARSADTLPLAQSTREVDEAVSRQASAAARKTEVAKQRARAAAQLKAEAKAKRQGGPPAVKQARDAAASKRKGSAAGFDATAREMDTRCAHASRDPDAPLSPGDSAAGGGSADDSEGEWDAEQQRAAERAQSSDSLEVADVSLAKRRRVAKDANIICLVVDRKKMPEMEECDSKELPMWLPLPEVRMAPGGNLSRSYNSYLTQHSLEQQDLEQDQYKFAGKAKPCCGHFGGNPSAPVDSAQYNPWATSGRCKRPTCKWR